MTVDPPQPARVHYHQLPWPTRPFSVHFLNTTAAVSSTCDLLSPTPTVIFETTKLAGSPKLYF